jgi:hypothetical protein
MILSFALSLRLGIGVALLGAAIPIPPHPAVAQDAPDSLSGVAATGSAASHTPARHLMQLALKIIAPVLEAPLLSLIPSTLHVGTTYTGSGVVTYTLVHGPDGMTIDVGTGTLTWTPPLAMEGQQATVAVSATDGTLNADVSFVVQVAETHPLTTTLVGQTLTVTDAGPLKDLAFTFPTETTIPLVQIGVVTLDPTVAPPVPSTYTRISDFFRVTPVVGSNGMITITMKVTGLPVGRKPQDLRLFLYVDGITDMVGSATGPFWCPTWLDLEVLPSGQVTLSLKGLGELMFIGVAPPAPAAALAFAGSVPGLSPVNMAGAVYPCAPLVYPNGQTDPNQQVCTIPIGVDLITVTVQNPTALNTTPVSTIQDLLGALAKAKAMFSTYGMRTDPQFTVCFDDSTTNGYVTPLHDEDRRVLHITNFQIPQELMYVIAAHEFFHHAQSRTTEAEKISLIDQGDTSKWLTEGTARWFDDEFDDSFNSYRETEAQPLPPVLEVGLGATNVDNRRDSRRGYARFAFWKMVSRFCPGFSIPQILNVPKPQPGEEAVDASGIANFKSHIESEAWGCDFSPMEATSATLAQALGFYAIVTTDGGGDMTKLDDNEPPYAFGVLHPIAPTPCDVLEHCSYTFDSPPASAVTVKINSTSNLDRAVGFVQVTSEPADKDFWVAWTRLVRIWDNDPQHGQWLPTKGNSIYYCPDDTQLPEQVVAFINPDPSISGSFSIRTGIITPRITVKDITCSYLGPYGAPELHNAAYHVSAHGTASGVPGLSYLLFGDQNQSTSDFLTCPSWGGGNQHGRCGSDTRDSITTNWTLDYDPIGPTQQFTPQGQLLLYSRWNTPKAHIFDTKPLPVTCSAGH